MVFVTIMVGGKQPFIQGELDGVSWTKSVYDKLQQCKAAVHTYYSIYHTHHVLDHN